MTDSTSQKVAIGIVAATALMIIVIAAARLMRVREPHVDVDRGRYPVTGIDLSAHNGVPDFDSIAASGIDFVYLKASEGIAFRDPVFMRNYASARHAGIAVGAYHFFRFDCDGRRQALNALRATEGCTLDLPIAIDVEESGNPAQFSTEIVVGRLQAMVAHLQGAGHKVIIYTNKNGDARFVRQHFDNIDEGDPELWICSFTNPPINRRPWRLWQYSHCSSIPGIKGAVDVNTFNGDRREWEEWIVKQRAKPHDIQ